MITHNLLVIGATGRVGRHVVQYAQERGWQVTALVRRADADLPSGVRRILGNALALSDIMNALPGHTAVASAVGGYDPNGGPMNIHAVTMQNVVAAMQAQGMRRVVAVAGSGILQETPDRQRRQNPGFMASLIPVSEDHHNAYLALAASGLDWTLVCPPHMPTGQRTGHYRTQPDNLLPDTRLVSAEDVADFLVAELAQPRYTGHRVAIAY